MFTWNRTPMFFFNKTEENRSTKRCIYYYRGREDKWGQWNLLRKIQCVRSESNTEYTLSLRETSRGVITRVFWMNERREKGERGEGNSVI